MRKVLCLLLALMLVTVCYAGGYVTLADATDKSPVVGASVISANGLIIGITDKTGGIRVGKSDFPLSFRSLGYDPKTLSSADCDTLSDHKNHTWSPWFFKVLGMTMDVQQADFNLIYQQNPSGKYDLNDFISGTYNMHILGKGKQLKKMFGVDSAIHMDCYLELYPVRIEHLTADEYKELKATYYSPTEPFQSPANIQPLAPAIEALVNRF